MPASRRRTRSQDRDPSILRTSLTRFVLLSVGALVLVGAGVSLLSNHIARDEAVRDAERRSEGMATGIAAPLINADLRTGDTEAVRRLTHVLENRMRDGSVSHILLWDQDGRLLWSDDPEHMAEHVALDARITALVGTSATISSFTGQRPRHVGQRPDEGPLLEVYVGARDADGVPFVFEAYIPPQSIAVDRDAIFRELLPVGLVALLLFQGAILPLAFSLARRVDRAREHSATLLARSLASWHEERRQLAQALHDGVVQDLSAASYVLPSILDQLPADRCAEPARAAGRTISALLVEDVQALRTLTTELLPTDLRGDGLAKALEALLLRATERGVAVQLDVAPSLGIGADVAGLVYRVVREGLNNVFRHAEATRALVRVTRRGDTVEVSVRDDGRGVGEVQQRPEGHFGLRLLEDLVGDVGGTLVLRDLPEGETELQAAVPATLPQ